MRTRIEDPKQLLRFGHWLFILALVFTIQSSISLAQSASDPSALADQAIARARAGQTDEALQLYKRALAIAPDNMEILRDYAVVLGWAGQYSTAIPEIQKVRSLENNQPDWAIREFAATYLFGDQIAESLKMYDNLIERGDISEQTLNRRALALRWMGNTGLAQEAYRALLKRYPKSVDGAIGLAYSMSDEGRHAEALRYLDSNSDISANDPKVLKTRIRILNWMGSHYEAQTLLSSLPSGMKDDREVLEDRISAQRWGGNPNGAMQDVNRLSQLFPGTESRRLSEELHTEYGQSVSPYFRFVKDSDGLIDRAIGTDITAHLNPAFVVRAGYQYRWLEQQQNVRSLVRYDLGLSGTVNRRVSFYTTLGTVDYRVAGLKRKATGDASVTITANDKLKLTGGGGRIAMDAYQSIPNQVTAPFGFGDVAYSFNSDTRVQGRVSHYSFSDKAHRNRTDFQFTRFIVRKPVVKLSAGWRSNFMWHDNATPDFWSPSRFHSHAGVAQAEGRITPWLDYLGEIAAGWQSERGIPLQHPFQTSMRIAIHPDRHWRTILETGKSTSSLDRALPGLRSYSRWYAAATMEFRFP